MSGPPAQGDLVSYQGHYAGAASRFMAYAFDVILSTGVFTLALAGISYARRTDWSGSSREFAEGSPESSGLAPWLLVATLALLLIEPLMAWSFRHGLTLLITLITVGLCIPFIPHNRWGALIIAAVLLAGVIAMSLLGNRTPAIESAPIARRSPRARRWFPFGRGRR